MPVNAVGNVNTNYVKSYRDSLNTRKQTASMLGMGGLTVALGSTYIKNNWVGLTVLFVGGLSGLIGMIDWSKADKELKNLNSQQKLNTEI